MGLAIVDGARLCLQRGAQINAVDANGQTALHSAAVQRSDEFIEFLVDNGARLDLKDKQGRLPLDLARRRRPRSADGA